MEFFRFANEYCLPRRSTSDWMLERRAKERCCCIPLPIAEGMGFGKDREPSRAVPGTQKRKADYGQGAESWEVSFDAEDPAPVDALI